MASESQGLREETSAGAPRRSAERVFRAQRSRLTQLRGRGREIVQFSGESALEQRASRNKEAALR